MEEVSLGIGVAIEEDCRFGESNLSRDVGMVDGEGLLGCVAAGRISIGLPGL